MLDGFGSKAAPLTEAPSVTRLLPVAEMAMVELMPDAKPAASVQLMVGNEAVLHTQGSALDVDGALRPGDRRSLTVIEPDDEGPALVTTRS